MLEVADCPRVCEGEPMLIVIAKRESVMRDVRVPPRTVHNKRQKAVTQCSS